MDAKDSVSRRSFMKTAAAAGAVVGSLSAHAQDTAPVRTIKVALIGCGGRGNSALGNSLAAGKHLGLNMKVVATADYVKGKAEGTGGQHGVPADKCYGGADGYKGAVESDADVIIMATPPGFRPVHFAASIEAGKHVFMEKPVAVDPPGARRIMAVGEKAKEKGLAVVAGTQRRHQAGYRRNQFAVSQGAIGTILGGTVHWCGSIPWIRTRGQGQSDADYMINNWLNFYELSGDHIVEQHVHNIDVANWFIGHPPVSAHGFGGRARRTTGNQYDFFSIDFDYGEGCHIHSMCRQISGCYSRVAESFTGTEGTAWGGGRLESKNGKPIEIPDFPEHGGPYEQEHIDLLQSILDEKPLNEAQNVADATLAAVIGRMSSYTGQMIRWTDVTTNAESKWYNYACKPSAEDFEAGEIVAPQDDVIPIPG